LAPKYELVLPTQLASPPNHQYKEEEAINPIEEPSSPLYILLAAYKVKVSLPVRDTITDHQSPLKNGKINTC
jgi:hypothetical protein